MKMTEQQKLKTERRALVAKIEAAHGSIRIELDGAPGGEPGVHGQHRIKVWRDSIARTRDKLATLDRHLAVFEADEAATTVREVVEQINATGATADKAAKLQAAMFTLVSNRRVGMSSDAIRKKIGRLMNPTEGLGIRVRDSWDDFPNMIAAKPLPGVPQTQERVPVQAPLGDNVDSRLAARDVHTTKGRAA
jgi:hypothetical protein